MSLESGTKYIIRSDVVFNRKPSVNPDTSYLTNIYFKKAVELYREANNQEMKGNAKVSSLLYSRALALRQFH